MQSPPFPRYLVPPRSKYSPQHHVLKHPQLPFLPQCQRPSFTPIQNDRQDMKTNVQFWSYLAQFFLELEIFRTEVVQKIETHILCSIGFFQINREVEEKNLENVWYSEKGHKWKCNANSGLCMVVNWEYKHKLRICITMLLVGFAWWITETTNTNSDYVLQCWSLALHGGYLRLQTQNENMYYSAAHCLCMVDNWDYKRKLRICITMLLVGFAWWITETTNTNSEYVLQCCSLALHVG